MRNIIPQAGQTLDSNGGLSIEGHEFAGFFKSTKSLFRFVQTALDHFELFLDKSSGVSHLLVSFFNVGLAKYFSNGVGDKGGFLRGGRGGSDIDDIRISFLFGRNL